MKKLTRRKFLRSSGAAAVAAPAVATMVKSVKAEVVAPTAPAPPVTARGLIPRGIQVLDTGMAWVGPYYPMEDADTPDPIDEEGDDGPE